MRKLFLATTLVALSVGIVSPSYAWGAREQGIVTGIVGTIVAQQIFRPPVVVVPQGVPMQPGYAPGYAPQGVPMQPGYAPPMVPYYPGTVYPDFVYRPMFRDVDVWIPECQCYRTMRVQIR